MSIVKSLKANKLRKMLSGSISMLDFRWKQLK